MPNIARTAQVAFETINPPPTGVRPIHLPTTSERAMEFQYGFNSYFEERHGKNVEFPCCTVAYTATPQAPLLHNEHFDVIDATNKPHRMENPFRPTKAVLMKRPSDSISPWSFMVPNFYDGWYTGPSLFSDDDCTMNEAHPPRAHSLTRDGIITGTTNPGASLLTSPNQIIAPPLFGYDDGDLPTSGATGLLKIL